MGGGCGSRSPGFLEGLLEYGTGTSKILGESEGGGSDGQECRMQMQERETAVQKQNQEKGILNVLPWRQDGGKNVGIVKAGGFALYRVVSDGFFGGGGSAKNIIQYADSITRSIR
jgi:hypothetical protein